MQYQHCFFFFLSPTEIQSRSYILPAVFSKADFDPGLCLVLYMLIRKPELVQARSKFSPGVKLVNFQESGLSDKLYQMLIVKIEWYQLANVTVVMSY